MSAPPAAVSGSACHIRVHATNLTAIGATQLAQSLLPAIERAAKDAALTIYLPGTGDLANYKTVRPSTSIIRRKRRLPNILSRALECMVFGRDFEGDGDVLVLGDIPLRCKGRQTVFVQNLFIASRAPGSRTLGTIKFLLARALFRLNCSHAAAFIVQTEAMKRALCATYSQISERTHVVAQPVPGWLQAAKLKRTGRKVRTTPGLDLVYPAAEYPHKNHRLLSRIGHGVDRAWPVSSLILTVTPELHPNPVLAWIKCVGRLDTDQMLSVYGSADALLFLSLSESLGFPLLEAMSVGLPVVCPDLPYARVLCGDQAIYFAPNDIDSLHAAVMELDERFRWGWWPDWTKPMHAIPTNWDAVANAMLQIASGRCVATSQ